MLDRADKFFDALLTKTTTVPRWNTAPGGGMIHITQDVMKENPNGINHSIYSTEDLETYKFLEITDWDMSFYYYAITRAGESEDGFAKRFTQYLLSPDVQNLAEEFGYMKVSD